MNEDTVKEWLTGITYRPGWEIRTGGLHGDDQYVIVWATAPDVCEPGKAFQTGPLFRMPVDITSREQFCDWLMDVCIPGVEQHERYEWFRVDGKHHRDPHAPGMPAFAVNFEEKL